MNNDYPPLQLPQPESRPRRPQRPRRVPIPAELLARRVEIAQILGVKIASLSRQLQEMSDEERRAVFYRLQHEGPIDLVGTGLKKFAEPTPDTTLAIPKETSLDKFAQKLERFGTSPLRKGHVTHESYAYLTEIAEAQPTDRLSPELRVQYDDLVKKDRLVCEIEFFSLRRGKNQQKSELASFLDALEMSCAAGTHGTLFEHEMALPTCRAVIRCTGKFFKELVEEPKWIAVIRWFEARPQFQTFSETWDKFQFKDLAPIDSPPEDAPIVCVVDTGISAGNPFLEPITDELRSYLQTKPDNPSDEFGHGSAVASLVSYYALNLAAQATNSPKVWVAGARILNEFNQLEDERLFSRILRDVVSDFAPLGVKVFCLAVGDESKQWNRPTRQGLPRKSWVARTIDQLSREHDVVFVTCTGNISLAELRDHLADSNTYPGYFSSDNTSILDPGQAALALSVGSIAQGTQVMHSASIPMASPHQPSPFTRCGPGIRKEVKPELVDYGGNLAYDSQLARPLHNPGLDVVTATHQLTPAAAHTRGTSFAAARVAHRLAVVYHDLQSLGLEDISASLLKAFLVNSAQYPATSFDDLRTSLECRSIELPLMLLGYGVADDIRATYNDDFSVTMYFQGEIEPDQVLFFDVPVPAELVQARSNKRLSVTVAHSPEVQRWGLERYLGVDLKWRMFRGDINRDDIVQAMSEEIVQSDEEVDELPSEEVSQEVSLPSEIKFALGVNRRSRGTVQHDWYEWQVHRSEYSENHYTLAVAAYKRWIRSVSPTPLSVVIRLEDLGRTVPIYSRVQQILAEIEVQVRTRGG